MPEGPEVSFLAKQIQEACDGRVLTHVSILHGRYKNHGPPPHWTEFQKALPLKLEKVDKKGKVLFLHFASGWVLISKLGMTGWWYVDGKKPTWRNMRPHVVFHLTDQELTFSDVRNYGTMTVTRDPKVIAYEYGRLAQDVMSKDWTVSHVLDALRRFPKRSHQFLEDAIMDQSFFVSGIGNYLKAEVLYDAKISPLRTVSSLSNKEWTTLCASAKRITSHMLRVMLKEDDDAYMGSMKVYQRNMDPLGNNVDTHTAKNGRTTFWVPAIQR